MAFEHHCFCMMATGKYSEFYACSLELQHDGMGGNCLGFVVQSTEMNEFQNEMKHLRSVHERVLARGRGQAELKRRNDHLWRREFRSRKAGETNDISDLRIFSSAAASRRWICCMPKELILPNSDDCGGLDVIQV